MYDFAYHKPTSIADAVKLLAADADARPISGGMTLLPALKHRLNKPSAVIDLSGIAELKGVSRSGNTIRIGAMTRHVDVANASRWSIRGASSFWVFSTSRGVWRKTLRI